MEQLKHECGVAMIRLLKPLAYYRQRYGTYRYGLDKLYLMMEKQHNRGQEGAGIACVNMDAPAGEEYMFRERAEGKDAITEIFKNIETRGEESEGKGWAAAQLYMGHLRYSTTDKHGLQYIHPFLRRNNWRAKNLCLCGNFNMTNIDEVFQFLTSQGQSPRVYGDAYITLELMGHRLDREVERLFMEAKEQGLESTNITQYIDSNVCIANVLKTGEFGVSVMALLDEANTSAFGNPEITKVNIGTRNKPGILVSGHDLSDLKQLLEQTKDEGIDIYTHSEMLPAHYYPAFKKYDNFAGNYGNAWWKQKAEFTTFNGPILMTTNCIVPPADSYKDRLWTTGAAGYPGCRHIDGAYGETKDFSAIIEQAKTCPAPQEIESGQIVGGFAHEQVFALADKIVEAVKSGAIRKFVVMAGCDGRMKSREYYHDFAERLPKDVVILTAGCAKYKYNKLNLGDINGIPRVLDAGQCNDSYSLALIALKLKEIFGLDDVNDLPIVYNIAWYEQKAVIVLLALLYLGVKNIHLGPTLPAFLSPNVANVLVKNFGIAGIGSVDDDLELFFGQEK